MPLIILSGLPTSGKSTRAAQLHAYLTARVAAASASSSSKKPPYRVHLVSDQSLSISRAVYDLSALPPHARSANAPEKDARASTYAAVKRLLSERDIVILDGLNYIKGWRYQLHCEAKAVRTQSVVLQVGCTPDRSRAVNEARIRRRQGADAGPTAAADDSKPADATDSTAEPPPLPHVTLAPDDAEEPYDPANWENLVFRYEEPNPMTRWDSPLFTLVWDDDESQSRATFDAIWEAVAGDARTVVRPHKATVQRSRESGGDYLYLLDRETQDIVKRLLDAQQQADDAPASVPVPRGDGGADDLHVHLPGAKVGLAQLQRLRRAYVGLNRGGIGLEEIGDIRTARLREAFVSYLNDAFDKDQ